MREFVGVDGVLSCCVSDRGSFATAKRPLVLCHPEESTAKRPLAGGIWPVISRPSMPDASAELKVGRGSPRTRTDTARPPAPASACPGRR